MKSVLRTFVVIVVMMVLPKYAEAKVWLRNGDESIVRVKAMASFSILWSESKVGEKMMEKYLTECDSAYAEEIRNEAVGDAELAFKDAWKKVNRKGMRIVEGGDGEYRIMLKVTEMSFGSSFLGGLLGYEAGGAVMSGEIIVYRGEERVAEWGVQEQRGAGLKKVKDRVYNMVYLMVEEMFGGGGNNK